LEGLFCKRKLPTACDTDENNDGDTSRTKIDGDGPADRRKVPYYIGEKLQDDIRRGKSI
jgi:hypothetical protein